jgi:hypothetical protein
MTSARPGARPVPQLLEEYLSRGPERRPWRLVTPTVLLVARMAILFRVFLARDGSVAWLFVFLLAELHFVLRLMTVGNRLTGLAPDGGEVTRGALGRAFAWAALALALAVGAGLALARSGGAELFGGEGVPAIVAVLFYLGIEVFELARAVAATRRGGRRFVSAATIAAAFFVIGLALAPILFFCITYVVAILRLGDAGRSAVAVSLLVAKGGAELAAIWFPFLAEAAGLRVRPREPENGR